MTDTMIEKMARAIAAVVADPKLTADEEWESLIESERQCAADMARAALLALRDGVDPRKPTQTMFVRSFIDHVLQEGEKALDR